MPASVLIFKAQGEADSFFVLAEGHELPIIKDLKPFAESLPRGFAIASSNFAAGVGHLEQILIQTAESWSRGLYLARNKSLDLLMRLTCQSQIERAIQTSGLESSKTIVLFGLSREQREISYAQACLAEAGAVRRDELLELDPGKISFLRKFHSLPHSVHSKDIPSLLVAKAALLVFMK